MIKLKRVYEEPEVNDGYRVLVDRLWPRGLTKQKAKADLWLKDLGPSPRLRKWFNYQASRWDDFVRKYHRELNDKKEMLDMIYQKEREEGEVTLLFAAKDTEHNEAVVIRDYLIKEYQI